MKRLLLSTTALLALATAASADTITIGGQVWTIGGTQLQLVASPTSGNQVQNLPCIICGATQPQQPTGFGYTDFGNTGNQTDLAFFSSGTVRDTSLGFDTISGTNYSGAFLTAFLQSIGDPSLTFTIGIDVNDTNQAQTLESFFFLDLTTHTVLASYSPGPGGTLLPDINNGTGFPDYQLTGLTLDGINPGDQLAFYSRISGANDGPDSFYLVAAPVVTAVPEASTWAMMILGFIGVAGYGGMRSRRNKDGASFRLA